jgi:hypothetical protein
MKCAVVERGLGQARKEGVRERESGGGERESGQKSSKGDVRVGGPREKGSARPYGVYLREGSRMRMAFFLLPPSYNGWSGEMCPRPAAFSTAPPLTWCMYHSHSNAGQERKGWAGGMGGRGYLKIGIATLSIDTT